MSPLQAAAAADTDAGDSCGLRGSARGTGRSVGAGPFAPLVKTIPRSSQSLCCASILFLPWALTVALHVVPAGVVIWPICTWPPVIGSCGALRGSIQKTAPSLTTIGLVSLHPSKSMPMLAMAPLALPPVTPTESHESEAAALEYA